MNTTLKNIAHDNDLKILAIPKDNGYTLKLSISQNEIGIICRVTAVLFLHGWDIIEANAETSKNGFVTDVFYIQNKNGQKINSISLEEIRKDLYQLFFEELSIMQYFESRTRLESFHYLKPSLIKSVNIYNPKDNDVTIIDVRAKDRPGILFQISQILFLYGIDILSFTARSEDGEIRDTFLVRKESGEKIIEEEIINKLREELLAIL